MVLKIAKKYFDIFLGKVCKLEENEHYFFWNVAIGEVKRNINICKSDLVKSFPTNLFENIGFDTARYEPRRVRIADFADNILT